MKIASTLLTFCVAGLLALGMVMLYSASMTQGGEHFLVRQLIWCALGLAVCVAAASLDYRHLKRLSLVLFIITVVLLVLVLIPGIGTWRNGARRWFDLKFMSLQPSELAKIAIILLLAHYGEYYQRNMGEFKRGLLIPGAMVGLVLVLILAGKDYGTTLLVASVSGATLLLAGVRWRFILPMSLAFLAVLALAIWCNPVRRARVMAWIHPEQHAALDYQQKQALLALGAGGVNGLGLAEGRQKNGFVPEDHTDFILSIIGEELGLVATMGIALAFVIFVGCGMVISWRAGNTFGMLLAAGITVLIGLQAFVNMSVVTSLLPNKGLPLPFISYGGSNLLAMLASVGLLLSVARHAPQTAASGENLSAPEVVA